MEVEDEAVDMTEIDELSMSILEPVPGLTPANIGPADTIDAVTNEGEDVGNVTITINSRGEINVDQSAIAEVLGSGQQTARVTFVKVDDEGMSTIENQVDLDASELLAAVGQADGAAVATDADNVNVGLILDPDQLNKLEKVLESDEARNLLGDAAISVDQELHKTESAPSPMRRSQRQVDREQRQTAEKIRAENQEKMKLEDGKVNKKDSPPLRGRGKMRGGSRPSRTRKIPKHLADKDMVTEGNDEQQDNPDEEEEGGNDEDDDSDSGSWASEDDPDRLWCICQEPHSNKFMICCDQCLDWFHGKCVGITKAQGKELEEAGKDWKCPQCLEGKKRSAANDGEDLNVEPMETDDKVQDDAFEEQSPSKTKTPDRSKVIRKSSTGGNESGEKRKRTFTCHMCNSEPRENSIYCSDTCITAHAQAALSMLTKDGKTYKANNPVVVLEPKTNTLLTGPNAPTESSLQAWLQTHESYHVVMPGKKVIAKSSEKTPSKERSGPKIITPHREQPEKKKQRIEDLIKKRPIKTKEEMVAEAKAALRRSVSTHDSYRPSKRERRNSESTEKRNIVIKRKIERTKPEPVEPFKDNKSTDKNLRSMVVKGTRDALLEKVKKSDLVIEESKVLKIVKGLIILFEFGNSQFFSGNKMLSTFRAFNNTIHINQESLKKMKRFEFYNGIKPMS